MSTLEVNAIAPITGSSDVTLGGSSKNIKFASGTTIDFNTNTPTLTLGADMKATPSFQAYLGSNSSALTNGTQTKIQYNTEQWDTDSTYDNSSNYRFTPGVVGKYWCYASAKIDSSGNFPHDAYLSLYKNGSVYKQYQRLDQGSDFSGVITIGAQVDLDADDYVEVYIVVYDGVNTFISSSQSSTLFGAFKIIGA